MYNKTLRLSNLLTGNYNRSCTQISNVTYYMAAGFVWHVV